MRTRVSLTVISLAWTSRMVGKFSSVVSLLEKLRTESIDNIGVTELVQGQTRRWVIIWSLMKYRLPRSLTHISRAEVQEFLPPTSTVSSEVAASLSDK